MSRASMLVLLAVLACQGDPVGEFGGDAGATGGTGAGGGATHGPGPFGALPAGYCCTSDQECRFRNCADFGGVRMCADECSHDDGCNTGKNLTCSFATGYCEPSGAPECIPAEQWVVGTKKAGACCIPTGDGTAGQECEANRCVAVGDLQNPFICTQPCADIGDCPPKYSCLGHSFCAPLASLYDCD